MSISHKNISALQSKPYFSELIIEQINKRKNVSIDIEHIKKHNSYLSKDIAEELLDIDFNYHTNIILFGFYDIPLIEHIVNNMSKLSTLTIFEKDIELIVYIFGTKDVSHILSDSRVVLITGDKEVIRNPVNLRVTLREFGYNLPRIKIISANYIRQLNANYVNEVSHYVISQINYIATSLGNDINDMLEGFDHTIENWPNLLKSLGVNALKDRYKGIPAIIVSGGPSLDKNVQYLKKAYGRALILVVDTTLKKVLDLGIIPDAVSTIERPDNMYSIFYEEVNIPEDVVFIGPSVVTKQIIDEFSRFIFTGRKGEPPVRAIASTLEYESLEIGMSCAHIPFAFADYVGADPIVFIGQDLAFSKEGNTHFGEASIVTKEGAKKQELVEVEANDGGKLTTNKIYYQFLIWFQNQIAQITDKTIINATEGGAKIEGAHLMTFEDVINTYCNKSVKHLSAIYDEVLSQSEMNKKSKMEKIIEFLNLLITESKLISKEASTYKEALVSLKGAQDENINSFFSMRKEMDAVLHRNYVLNFLFQTITLKYNRAFNMYASMLNIEEWNKLKSEGIRYYSLMQQVSDALIVRFNQYLNHIKTYSTKDTGDNKES